MTRIRARDFAARGIDGDVRHRDELARGDLVHHDIVRGGEKVAWFRMLSRERAEHELRHRHIGRRFDTVPGYVAENDGEASVAELEEVVHVAADVDARRRLVHLTYLEAGDGRLLPRQQRALHRVGELFLLLIEPGVVDGECSLAGDRDATVDRLLADRVAGAERQDRQRGNRLGRRRDGHDGAGPSLREERLEHVVPTLEPEGLRLAEEALYRSRAERLRPIENHTGRVREVRVLHVQRPRRQQLAAAVRQGDQRCIDIEHVDDCASKCLERRLEREALRERA